MTHIEELTEGISEAELIAIIDAFDAFDLLDLIILRPEVVQQSNVFNAIKARNILLVEGA